MTCFFSKTHFLLAVFKVITPKPGFVCSESFDFAKNNRFLGDFFL
jgi:hypothetical protein